MAFYRRARATTVAIVRGTVSGRCLAEHCLRNARVAGHGEAFTGVHQQSSVFGATSWSNPRPQTHKAGAVGRHH
eukprot:4376496-Lingulodinium_polyedra.AAC.1